MKSHLGLKYLYTVEHLGTVLFPRSFSEGQVLFMIRVLLRQSSPQFKEDRREVGMV